MEEIVVDYIGDGMFEAGVPARDLTAEEWAQVPEETQKRLIDQGIYRLHQPNAQELKQAALKKKAALVDEVLNSKENK